MTRVPTTAVKATSTATFTAVSASAAHMGVWVVSEPNSAGSSTSATTVNRSGIDAFSAERCWVSSPPSVPLATSDRLSFLREDRTRVGRNAGASVFLAVGGLAHRFLTSRVNGDRGDCSDTEGDEQQNENLVSFHDGPTKRDGRAGAITRRKRMGIE